ncbi:MAG: 2,4-dihydroxyhept-2-ene,7-dioic acid aldolase [Actinomycetospora sp.]|jgi:4-hydroxy-2-oxoheptanedioate aldolase|nr:2,4-dihydroxyhept-2-ene,7-dioic acid aldolase [Actinomycetospora sp.]
MRSVRERLQAVDAPLSGFVNLVPSPVVTQVLAAAGADVVLIDQEHGPIGPESLHAMVASTAHTSSSPWVRVSGCDEAAVKTALDAGAEGIMFPLITTAESAAACVALTRYPPAGRRGWGPFVAHSRWGVGLFDYLEQRGGETICTMLVETRSAIENIEEICEVDGIDSLTIAPFDLSTDLGVPGQMNAPELVAAVDHAERVILEAGIPLGGAALTKEQTQALVEKGYRLLWHQFDVLILEQFVTQAIGWRST